MLTHKLYFLTLACLMNRTLNAFMNFGDQPFGGIIDSKMTKMSGDGRDTNTTSVFEIMRLKLEEQELSSSEHPMLSAGHGKDVDVQMNMVWDWNHVIALKLTDASDDI